jgi:hypothetical protein
MVNLVEINIRNELKKLSNQGFIESLRKNNTGIGFTLETKLGIKENNDAEPDFLFNNIPVELKAQREHTSSNITLFTLEPPRGTKGEFKDLKLLRKYGYMGDGRKNLYVTMKIDKTNPQGFKLQLDDNENLLISHNTDGIIWSYPIDYIFAKIKKKLSHKVLLVTAESKEEGDKEFFHYKKGRLYSKVTEEGFIELIKSNALVVEFRMHIGVKEGREWARNHGTGFRLNLRHLDKLFAKKEIIL